MNHHLPHVIYGAVIGHFLMALWRKMLSPAPRVIVVPSKPTDSTLVPNRDGTTRLVFTGFPEPRKLDSGQWMMDAGLLHSMRDEGYIFNPRTGGWDKDPNYVEPPEYEAMPF